MKNLIDLTFLMTFLINGKRFYVRNVLFRLIFHSRSVRGEAKF